MARKFGIELEVIGGVSNMHDVAAMLTAVGVSCVVEGYNHQRRSPWKIVTDGSLSGQNAMEIVSPPLKGAAGLREVALVARTLSGNGITVNRSCGFHVHVDARDLSDVHFQNLAKLFVCHEEHLKSILPPSRRASNWAVWPSQILRGSLAERFDRVSACPTFTSLRQLFGMDRYRALNLESFGRHGTVEFRAHSGTVDAPKIVAWIALCVSFVRRAVVDQPIAMTWGNGRPRNFWDAVRAAGREHVNYFRDRRDYFARAAA